MATRVRNDLFNANKGLNRGATRTREVLWYIVKMIFYLTAFPWPYCLKRNILRAFGAKVGNGVIIKPQVNIHLPWKLSIGQHSWIGEQAWILNFEQVEIGQHVCISQRVLLCTGNHDYRALDFAYRNQPITIGDGAWIGATCFIGPGVLIGDEAVATAGSIITQSLPANIIQSATGAQKVRFPTNPQASAIV